MEKSKLSQLVTEILSYAKERYGSIATPDAATVVCAAATLLSSDGSYNITDEDDQKKLVRKLVELSSDNKEHQFSPSFVATESILSISTSNPGVAGDINPFAQIDVEPTLKKDQDDPDSVEATLVTRYTTKGVINQLNAAWSDLKQVIDHVYDIESGILNNMPFDVFPSLLFGDRMKQYALNVINCLWETPEVKEAQHKATEIYAKEEASDLLEWRLNKYKETVKKWADFTASKFEKRYKDETQFLKLWNILHTTKCSIFVQNVDPVFKPKELTKAEQIEFKIWQLKELERKYSDMWKAAIDEPDGVEVSEPFLNKQEEIGEQIVKLEQKLKELKKNQN